MPNHWIIYFFDDVSLNFIKTYITSSSLISIRYSLTSTETVHTIGLYEGVGLSLSLPQINDIRQLNILLTELDYHYIPLILLVHSNTIAENQP